MLSHERLCLACGRRFGWEPGAWAGCAYCGSSDTEAFEEHPDDDEFDRG
jgi:rRNA maturation endonuclease Nob1